MKTLNQQIQYFEDFATNHLQLKGSFGFGNQFEINGASKPGYKPYVMWVMPVDGEPTEFTKRRRFLVIVAGLVMADQSNRNEVWSDTEQILDDLIKQLRIEDEDFDLLGDPLMFPVSEKFGDWVSGWQSEIVIETAHNSSPCDIPRI